MESEVSVFLCEVYDKKIRGILFSYGGLEYNYHWQK